MGFFAGAYPQCVYGFSLVYHSNFSLVLSDNWVSDGLSLGLIANFFVALLGILVGGLHSPLHLGWATCMAE